MKYLLPLLFIGLYLTTPSCVSKKKFLAVQGDLAKVQKDLGDCGVDLNRYMNQLTACQQEKDRISNMMQSDQNTLKLREEQINDLKDIDIQNARRWATELTPSMFKKVTGLDQYPDYLNKDIVNDSILNVFSNGEINYTLKGTHAKTSVIWNYVAPEGSADTHYSIMRGTKANLIIQQGEKEGFKSTLYVEKSGSQSDEEFMKDLENAIASLQTKYAGLSFEKDGDQYKIIIPDEFKVGHEAHFAQVTNKFLKYLKEGKMPDWEVPNMIAKYYTTTKAYEMSR